MFVKYIYVIKGSVLLTLNNYIFCTLLWVEMKKMGQKNITWFRLLIIYYNNKVSDQKKKITKYVTGVELTIYLIINTTIYFLKSNLTF